MNCDIIQDLLPLYADQCCSEESRRLVEAHLRTCPACREAIQLMEKPLPATQVQPGKPSRVKLWKASLLQSVLLFAAFGAITFGVAMEAESGYLDSFNSLWAFTLVIPATGFLLSLANWYFVRLYPSRKGFVAVSCCLTLGLTLAVYTWCHWHYGDGKLPGPELFFGWIVGPGLLGGTQLTILLSGLSAAASNWYARLLGKE